LLILHLQLTCVCCERWLTGIVCRAACASVTDGIDVGRLGVGAAILAVC